MFKHATDTRGNLHLMNHTLAFWNRIDPLFPIVIIVTWTLLSHYPQFCFLHVVQSCLTQLQMVMYIPLNCSPIKRIADYWFYIAPKQQHFLIVNILWNQTYKHVTVVAIQIFHIDHSYHYSVPDNTFCLTRRWYKTLHFVNHTLAFWTKTNPHSPSYIVNDNL